MNTTAPLNHLPAANEQTIVVKVENKAGLLARVADLFARRGYNIVSLAVAPTHDLAFSRITIVVDVESAPLEQVVKQLFKLINVVEIAVLAPGDSVERELLLATVRADHGSRGQIVELIDIFEGKILAVSNDRLTISLDGKPDKIDDFEALLDDYEIVEMHRSGRIALPKIGREVPRLRAV
ncbi:MAG: acetolactate synthase small subunit [Actinomycetia bacterium]|nr:acetolactate synthase small subunit [Actinomycetes bacterium]MCP4224058.1 acetolactate synthase small subunit [Actinomycetes bacterium]MCP5033623.1 acetolactate synthase small subunit [Actinomycetes bacterium]